MGINKIDAGLPMNSTIQNAYDSAKDNEFQKKLESALTEKDEKKLRQVSNELESIFIDMMLKQMRSTVDKSGLIESAPGREIFESMFDEKISEEASKGKGIGIADMIYKQVTRDMKNVYKKVEE